MLRTSISFSDVASHRQPVQQFAEFSEYVLDLQKRLVSVKFRKKVTIREIENYAASLRKNPLFDPDFAEITDMTEVEELDLNAEDFIRLADQIDPFSAQAKRAFVARDSVQKHAARMHRILRTQRDFSIFSSVAQAEQWIESVPSTD